MIVSAQILESARQRGERFRQFIPARGSLVRPDEIVDRLAAGTSPAAQRGARDLLRKMACSPWRVVASLHANERDGTDHITIEIVDTRYHLRLDARGCIFDITAASKTGVERVSGARPWAGPGTPA
jgi:hypothetical protein